MRREWTRPLLLIGSNGYLEVDRPHPALFRGRIRRRLVFVLLRLLVGLVELQWVAKSQNGMSRGSGN